MVSGLVPRSSREQMMRLYLLAAMLLGTTALNAAAPVTGVWRNPQRSVEIDMASCGQRLCGTVVWASDKAQDDAAAGGTDRLIGMQLFQGLVRDGPNHWQGDVFVPDLAQTVSGSMTLVDAQTLQVDGCAIPGLLCQTQIWTRAPRRR